MSYRDERKLLSETRSAALDRVPLHRRERGVTVALVEATGLSTETVTLFLAGGPCRPRTIGALYDAIDLLCVEVRHPITDEGSADERYRALSFARYGTILGGKCVRTGRLTLGELIVPTPAGWVLETEVTK